MPDTSFVKLGFNAKLYYGSAGSSAANEISNVTNVTLSLSKASADVTTRRGGGWRQKKGTLKEGTVEFEMIWDPTDPAFSTLFTGWNENTPVALKILDEEGGTGLDADFEVMDMTREEPLEDAIKAKVKCEPTYTTRTPTWV